MSEVVRRAKAASRLVNSHVLVLAHVASYCKKTAIVILAVCNIVVRLCLIPAELYVFQGNKLLPGIAALLTTCTIWLSPETWGND